jgi:outer membrane autotransporter protein
MKMKPNFLKTCILNALILSAAPMAHASYLSPNISVREYRQLALNEGRFQAGATNVPIYDTKGKVTGYLPSIPNFSGISDNATDTATGEESFVSALHVGPSSSASFYRRFYHKNSRLFSGEDTKAGLEELGINYSAASTRRLVGPDFKGTQAQAIGNVGLDIAIHRSSHLLISTPHLKQFSLKDAEKYLKKGTLIIHVGAGVQVQHGANIGLGWLVAGTEKITDVTIVPTKFGSKVVEINGTGGSCNSGNIGPNNAPSKGSPMTTGVEFGDSGSPILAWNPADKQWEVAGYTSMPYVTDTTFDEQQRKSWFAPEIAPDHAHATLLWNGTNNDGAGIISSDGKDWHYIGFNQKTNRNNASEKQWSKTQNLIFSGKGGKIIINAPTIDTGAGYLTFNANYTIENQKSEDNRLITAGFSINKNATVIDKLTTGKNNALFKDGEGTLVIEGKGKNNGTINIGQGQLDLNQQDGHAADIIRLVSGRSEVRLVGKNQLENTKVIFGVKGGRLNLFGHNLSWDDIIHMDNGATILSNKANSDSIFTFTGTGPKTYLGNFSDGGDQSHGLMKVVYAPKTNDSQWLLNGDITNKGGFVIERGQVISKGVLLAGPDGGKSSGSWYENGQSVINRRMGAGPIPTEYGQAKFDLGTSDVTIAKGANFTVGRDSTATGHFIVANNASIGMTSQGELLDNEGQGEKEGAKLNGQIDLSGNNSVLNTRIDEGFTASNTANISGHGHVIKNGTGTLLLTGRSDFTGGGEINQGSVIADHVSSLGQGENNWTLNNNALLGIKNANAAMLSQILDKIDNTSQGTLSFSGFVNHIDMSSQPDLFIGAVGNAALGTIASQLKAHNGEWRLGGGEGVLTVNSQLTGSHTLLVGNGSDVASGGVLILNNQSNDFDGHIIVNSGMTLSGHLGKAKITLKHGGQVLENSAPLSQIETNSQGVLAFTNNIDHAIDLSKYSDLTIGAATNHDITLNEAPIVAQNGAYHFGGSGTLNINTALSGNHNLILDGQDGNTGVVILNKANDLNGNVQINGGKENSTSGIAVVVNNAHALNSNNAVNLTHGAILNLNNNNVTIGSLSGDDSSIIANFGSKETNLTIDQKTNGVFASTLGSAKHDQINLIKEGKGTLTLSGVNHSYGDIRIDQGALKIGSETALNFVDRYLFNHVIVNKNATLDTNGYDIKNNPGVSREVNDVGPGIYTDSYLKPINLNGGTLSNSAKTISNIGAIELSKNSTLTGNLGIGDIMQKGHKMTLNHATLRFIPIAHPNGISGVKGRYPSPLDIGDITVENNSHLLLPKSLVSVLVGSLVQKAGNILVDKDSSVNFFDTEDVKAPLPKTIELNGGALQSGMGFLSAMGDGGQTNIQLGSPLSITQAGGQIDANNLKYQKTFNLNNTISGQGDLTINANSGVVFSNDASDFSGNWHINDGAFSWAPEYTGENLGSGDIILGKNAANLIVNNAQNQTLSNNIIGQADNQISKNGKGDLTLTGEANHYLGQWNINAGTLMWSPTEKNNSEPVTLGMGTIITGKTAVLALNSANAMTLNNDIVGQNQTYANIQKSGKGSLNLNANMAMANLDINDGDLNLNSSTLAGDVNFNHHNTNVNIKQASYYFGQWKNASHVDLNVQDHSRVGFTSNTTIDDVNLMSHGEVGFSQVNHLDNDNAYTLTAKNWNSDNGILVLNTKLGDSNSPTDKLNVTGSVSGHTKIGIRNVGGLGAKTQGNGIEIIHANHATKDAFSMINGSIAAGAFNYSLNHTENKKGQDWSLTSNVMTSPSSKADMPIMESFALTAPKMNIAVEKAVVKHAEAKATSATAAHKVEKKASTVNTPKKQAETNYRSIVSVMGSVQQISKDQSQQLMNVAQNEAEKYHKKAWARILNEHTVASATGAVSPTYHNTTSGVALGSTVWTNENQSIDWYAGYQKGNASIQGFANGQHNQNTGSVSDKNYTLGANWKAENKHGFVISTVQGSAQHIKVTSHDGVKNNFKGNSLSTQVTVGKHLSLNDKLTFTPTASVSDTLQSIDDTSITHANVHFNHQNSLSASLGGKLKWNIENTKQTQWNATASVKLKHDFTGNQHTVHFLTQSADVGVNSAFAKDVVTADVGTQYQVNDRITLTANVGYSYGINHVKYTNTNANLGIKYSF